MGGGGGGSFRPDEGEFLHTFGWHRYSRRRRRPLKHSAGRKGQSGDANFFFRSICKWRASACIHTFEKRIALVGIDQENRASMTAIYFLSFFFFIFYFFVQVSRVDFRFGKVRKLELAFIELVNSDLNKFKSRYHAI